MKISVVGGSAGVGLATVKRALERGHNVATLSRRKIDLPASNKLNALQGNALNESDVQKVIEGADVIIVTLGPVGLKESSISTDFAKVLLQLHSKKPIRVPVLVVTGFGAGDSRKYLKLVMRPLFSLILSKVYIEKTKMEEAIAVSDLQWEIVRPGLLTSKPMTEKYRTETTIFKGMSIGSISRSDVADYLVKEAEQLKHIGKYVAIAHK